MTPSEAAAILQVGRGASVADIDRAFQRRARISHPDRLVGATDADIRAATAEFVRLIAARDLLRAVAPRVSPQSEPVVDPLAGDSGEPLSFEEFVRIRDARAWQLPSVASPMPYRDDVPRHEGRRRAHHEWVVLPVVFSVLAVAIWGLSILLPG